MNIHNNVCYSAVTMTSRTPLDGQSLKDIYGVAQRARSTRLKSPARTGPSVAETASPQSFKELCDHYSNRNRLNSPTKTAPSSVAVAETASIDPDRSNPTQFASWKNQKLQNRDQYLGNAVMSGPSASPTQFASWKNTKLQDQPTAKPSSVPPPIPILLRPLAATPRHDPQRHDEKKRKGSLLQRPSPPLASLSGADRGLKRKHVAGEVDTDIHPSGVPILGKGRLRKQHKGKPCRWDKMLLKLQIYEHANQHANVRFVS